MQQSRQGPEERVLADSRSAEQGEGRSIRIAAFRNAGHGGEGARHLSHAQRAVDFLHGCQPLIDEDDEAAA